MRADALLFGDRPLSSLSPLLLSSPSGRKVRCGFGDIEGPDCLGSVFGERERSSLPERLFERERDGLAFSGVSHEAPLPDLTLCGEKLLGSSLAAPAM